MSVNAKNIIESETILSTKVGHDRKNQILYLDKEQYLTTVLNRFRIILEKHKSKKIPTGDYTLLCTTNSKNE
jgi:hypothetical protein